MTDHLTQHGLNWRVYTSHLLAEVLSNQTTQILRQPLLILDELLHQVAARAAEIDDPRLTALMLQLSLYTVADPASPDYNPELVDELIHAE